MKSKESGNIFKKYWFVMLVAILLVVFVAQYIVNENKNKETTVEKLTNDGKDVVYVLNGNEYYYADDLYNTLYDTYGANVGFLTYYHAIINEAVPTTEELTQYASNWAGYIIQNESQKTIDSYMVQAGYRGSEDLTQYCLDSLKYDKFMSDVYGANSDQYVKPTVDKENPRFVEHILIKVADVEKTTDENGNDAYIAKPTVEEQNKLDEVLAALKLDDKAFGEIASNYSEDEGTKSSGGYLGLVYESNKSKYVNTFANACMNLKDGEISDPIATNYGYHIIKVHTPSIDELIADTEFRNLIDQNNLNLDLKLIMEKGKELGFELKDQKVQEYIDSYLEAE